MPIPMYVEFKERAERERRAMSDVIREVIERGLERERAGADRQRDDEDA